MAPIPSAAVVVVMDTGARRTLAGSAYNERRASCEAAVQSLATLAPGIKALRDVDDALLARGRDLLDETTFRRASHVVIENRRPVEMAAALREADLPRAGRLMNDSHASLPTSTKSRAWSWTTSRTGRRHPPVGRRMTGAGFGGCAIALVDANRSEEFVAEVHEAYRSSVDLPSSFFACRPSAGARLIQT